MPQRAFPVLVIAVAAVLLLLSSVFTVRETELAIKFRFGEIVKSNYKPGLHFLMPMINNVKKFEKRIITKNPPPETFLTSEGKILNVDFFVKWRISNAAAYYRSTGGVEENAARRIIEIVKDSLKGIITRLTIQQIVAAERAALTGDLLAGTGQAMKQLGVDLVDVRIRRIDLPEDVSDSVYQRMKQSFAAQAAKLRAEGMAMAERIRAESDRKRTEILADASRDAQRVRGEGDAIAADTYAAAYSKNTEFYAFYRSLQAYRNSLAKEGDVMVVNPDGEFFRYLKNQDSK